MPPLDEGDVLYMPTALPGLSAGKAAQILQQTDRMIRSVPEVVQVFDLVADPKEQKDLGGSLPKEAALLLEALRAFVDASRTLAVAAPAP